MFDEIYGYYCAGQEDGTPVDPEEVEGDEDDDDDDDEGDEPESDVVGTDE